MQPNDAEEKLKTITSPVIVPEDVWYGLYAINQTDVHVLASWVSALHTSNKLGYLETAKWIEENLIGLYGTGIKRGFQDQKTGAVFIPNCYPMG